MSPANNDDYSWKGITDSYFQTNYPATRTAEFFKELSNKNIEAQLAQTSEIIINRETNHSDLQEIASLIANHNYELESGIDILNESVNNFFSELVIKTEENIELLNEISKNQSKLIELAKESQKIALNRNYYDAQEKKEFGLKAYKLELFDESIKSLKNSIESYNLDFFVHYILGNIYFFHKNDYNNAITHYSNSANIAARTNFPTHSCLSYLRLYLIYVRQENYKKAYESTVEATKILPDSTYAWYQRAKMASFCKEYPEATKILEDEVILPQNLSYIIDCVKEPLFQPIITNINEILNRLRQRMKEGADVEKKFVTESESFFYPFEPNLKMIVDFDKIQDTLELGSKSIEDCIRMGDNSYKQKTIIGYYYAVLYYRIAILAKKIESIKMAKKQICDLQNDIQKFEKENEIPLTTAIKIRRDNYFDNQKSQISTGLYQTFRVIPESVVNILSDYISERIDERGDNNHLDCKARYDELIKRDDNLLNIGFRNDEINKINGIIKVISAIPVDRDNLRLQYSK